MLLFNREPRAIPVKVSHLIQKNEELATEIEVHVEQENSEDTSVNESNFEEIRKEEIIEVIDF